MLTRLLAAFGLARHQEVTRLRAATSRVRTAERERGRREHAAEQAKMQVLEQKLKAAHERHVVEYAERTTLKHALLHYWGELKRLDTIFGSHDRRIGAQMAVALDARQATAAEPSTAIDTQLAALSTDYDRAATAWRQQQDPAFDVERIRAGGIRWLVPSSGVPERPLDEPPPPLLPVDELAMVRQFAVGGVMLDVGGGIGLTSIPRVLLGDFSRAYVAEPDAERYTCLVANTLTAGTAGAVVPDRVAIVGSADAEAGGGISPARLSFSQWIERLSIPSDHVRFIRIGARGPAVTLLNEGVRLLPRHDIVWQIDLDSTPGRTSPDDLAELTRLIAQSFTHFKEIGAYPAEHWRKAVEAKRLFKHARVEGLTGLLLLNLR